MSAATSRITRKFIGAVEDEWHMYSNDPSDYAIGLPIGFGASSVVYAAVYTPRDGSEVIPCALKVLDLDRLPPSALRLIQNETKLMSLSKHPNVLRVRGTWIDGHKLYIGMRIMNAGSVADVMRYMWPGGLEEEVVRCVLKQALEGLNYLHINGLMHRDVKAANLLIDDDGTVLLGDLGVAAFLWDSQEQPAAPPPKSRTVNFGVPPRSSHPNGPITNLSQRPKLLGKRKSFVGTPCWMAPEVINGKQYDASADIWSFGITAIELSQGRAPRSRADPHSVLLLTVTEAPPQLDRTGGPHKYSSAFAEVVAACLKKDPAARPTAAELLQMPFFKNAPKPSFLIKNILKELPPLTQRQERRKQPSIMTHGTMDSWDFSSSMPASPTTSVYSRRRMMNAFAAEHAHTHDILHHDSLEAPNGIPEQEEGVSTAESYASRIRARNRPSRPGHNRSRSGSYQGSLTHSPSHSRHERDSSGPYHSSTVSSRSSAHVQHVVESIIEDLTPEVDADLNGDSAAADAPEPMGIPVPGRANLAVPDQSTGGPSSPSSRSSASASVSSSTVPSTPPSSSSPSANGSGRLWKKLKGRLEPTGTVKERNGEVVPASPTRSGIRQKTLSKVFGRNANGVRT